MSAQKDTEKNTKKDTEKSVKKNVEKKRIVVKIGSSTLTTSESRIDPVYIEDLATQVAQVKAMGWDPVIVTSAAIACGLETLGINKRPRDMPSLQAAASVGQSALSTAYANAFARHGILTSLVLLTRRETSHRESYLLARETFERLLDLDVVPIVNENNTVSVEQISFGDNDTLAALVACLIGADVLVILSDVDGLYNANPRKDSQAQLVPLVEVIDERIIASAGEAGSVAGSGGMITKIQAARVLMTAGIEMVVCNGRRANALVDIVKGKKVGTRFSNSAPVHEITPRKLWIALGNAAKGAVIVDAGAREALVERGSSLLCVGVVSTEGSFAEDDIIDIKDTAGHLFGRGKVSAASDLLKLACGRSQEALRENRFLSSLAARPVMHRDELMIFE